MKRVPISEISLVNRKEPRIALPCVYKSADAPPASRRQSNGDAAGNTSTASVLAAAVADATAVDIDALAAAATPVVVEPEPEPVQSPLIRAAALLNKLVDKRDLQSTLGKCAELIADDGTGFVVVALSLRSLRTRDQRHVIGRLLAQLLDQQLLSPANIVEGFNQVLSSRTVRLILRGYAELLAPLFIDDSDRQNSIGGATSRVSVLGVLSALDCLSVKQLERLHDAIGVRLRDLVGATRARLLLPPAIDWATFKEQQSESLPLNEGVRERKQYIKIIARCRERDCNYSSTSVNNLRHHLAGVHHMDLPESRLRFETEQEFFNWKAQLERTDGVQFVHDHLSNYMCSWRGVDPGRRNRSGNGAGDCFGEPLHGLVCTAGLSVKQHTTGQLEVTAFLTHYHQQPLLSYSVLEQHYLHDSGRDGSADGIDSAGVVVTDDSGGDQLTDVVFIDGGLEGLDQDVAVTAVAAGGAAGGASTVSSDSIIDDMRRGFAMFENSGCYGDMNVVLYKEPQVPIPNSDVWQLNDFALSMASDEQLRRLSQHGGNVLCLSGAEDTPEGAVFHLISISVVDDLLDGWPVVWMLSNRCDEQIVSELIKHVGAAMEEKQLVFRAPLVLLTDSTALHRGWCAATDTDSPLFICPWHVQLAWESALPLIQADERADQVRSELLQLLRSSPAAQSDTTASSANTSGVAALTVSTSVVRVRELTLNMLKDPTTQAFGKYFRDNWLQRQHEWAGCHLAALVSHADLVVRGVQRSTEDLTVGRTNNTSIAGCVEELLDYLNARVQDASRKNNTLDSVDGGGDISAFTDQVLQYHAEAVSAAGAEGGVEVLQVEDGCSTSLAPLTWEVRCADEPHRPATVEQWTDKGRCQLEQPCQLQCPSCPYSLSADSGGVCLHQYSCSCPATSPCATLCRHIHLVALYRAGQLPSVTIADDEDEAAVQIADTANSGDELMATPATVSEVPTASELSSGDGDHGAATSDSPLANGVADERLPDVAVGGDAAAESAGSSEVENAASEQCHVADNQVEVSAVTDENNAQPIVDTVVSESAGTERQQPNYSEQRVGVANGLLALAVEVDSVDVQHLHVWQHCLEQMRATLPQHVDSAQRQIEQQALQD